MTVASPSGALNPPALRVSVVTTLRKPGYDVSIAATARIYPWARIIREADNFSIGERSQIDDFAFVNAGRRCAIGRFVHIASFVSIIGGGEFVIDDFAGLSAGVRVITGTDNYMGGFLTNPTVPREFTDYEISHVHIGKSAIVGTNAVIFPGVTIGEGAAVGACTVVRKDLAAWGVYAGDPVRKIGERDRDSILEKRRLLLQKLAAGELLPAVREPPST